MSTATSRASIMFAFALIAGALLAAGPPAHQAQSQTTATDFFLGQELGQEDDLFAESFKKPGGSILSQIEDEAVFSEPEEAAPSPVPTPGASWMLLSALLCFALAGWRAAALRRS